MGGAGKMMGGLLGLLGVGLMLYGAYRFFTFPPTPNPVNADVDDLISGSQTIPSFEADIFVRKDADCSAVFDGLTVTFTCDTDFPDEECSDAENNPVLFRKLCENDNYDISDGSGGR